MPSVKLSDKLIAKAKRHANSNNMSISEQIEHWSQIEKMAEDNPDLPYSFIKGILLALNETCHGD